MTPPKIQHEAIEMCVIDHVVCHHPSRLTLPAVQLIDTAYRG